MHYKNGNEAREGDPVICRPDRGYDNTIAGKIHSLISGTDTCNGTIAVPVPGGVQQKLVNVKDCYHAADAFAAMDAVVEQSNRIAEAATKTKLPNEYPEFAGKAGVGG